MNPGEEILAQTMLSGTPREAGVSPARKKGPLRALFVMPVFDGPVFSSVAIQARPEARPDINEIHARCLPETRASTRHQSAFSDWRAETEAARSGG